MTTPFQMKKNANGVAEVTSEELQAKLSEVKIIDVRRPDEFTGELGHISSATLSTIESELDSYLNTLSKDDTYVFVCRSGARSERAALMAQAKGFQSVFNMIGGMMAWNQKRFPVQR